MGIATKYVKDKVKTAATPVGPGLVGADDVDKIFFLEYEFYKELEPRVFVIGHPYSNASESLWSRIACYWNAMCFDEGSRQRFIDDLSGNFIHPQYRGLYSDETIMEDRETKLFQIRISKNSKKTHVVKLAEKSCQIVNNTAFAVFDYLWEYTIHDKGLLVRENGTFAHTWIHNGENWMLLGESGGPVSQTSQRL
jgi:hypothetical protein